MTTIGSSGARVGDVAVGEGHALVLVAGPCAAESDEVVLATARALVEMCGARDLPLIFKTSYEKDNRSAGDAYRGPGRAAGLALLAAVRRELAVAVTTDVHRVDDVPAVAAVVDLLQVPALLCRQTSLLEAAARSGRPVNVKKGQFMSPRGMAAVVATLRAAGAAGILLSERGTTFGYETLVCDMTAVPQLRVLGCPVLLDAGHAANDRASIPTLARCGVAAGADGVFVECHPDPSAARCDGQRMLSLRELERLLRELAPLARLVREQQAEVTAAGRQPPDVGP